VDAYIPVLVGLLVALVIAVGMVTVSHLLSERQPTREKLMPYECGVDPVGDARGRFPVKFYVIAMLFILFDIEIVFLFPWALIYKNTELIQDPSLRKLIISEMLIFLLVLTFGYIYLWRIGAFEWEWWESEDKASAGEKTKPEPSEAMHHAT